MAAPTRQGMGLARRKEGLAAMGDALALELAEVARQGGAVCDIWRVLTDGMAATTYVRAPAAGGVGYVYASVPDHRARIAAVGLAAQLLRMMPESSGAAVQVNVGGGSGPGGQPGDGAIDVTASERLDELEAAGGERGPIIAAVRGLLETLEAGSAAAEGKGATGAVDIGPKS